jgi:hypothetical protein
LPVRSQPLRRISRLVADFFHAKGPPLNLAVFRIVVCCALLFHAPRASEYLTLPDTLLHVPLGADVVYLLTPRSQGGNDALWWIFAISCLCGVVGLYARLALAVAAATGLLVYGLPQFYGKVDHSHHLVWFAVLLACSPCGDALSLDRWRMGGRVPPPAEKYALPLRIVWLLMGLIYFFPGAWKLLAVGWTWALGDNIKYTMYHKWFDLGGYRPPFAVDAFPLLYRGLGLGALAFELGFVIAIFLTPLRRLLVMAGLAFHIWIRLFLDIKLYGLSWCYAAFIDWAGLARRLSTSSRLVRSPDSEREPDRSGTGAVRVAGAILVAGVILSGATHLNSWPFAVYPTFAAEYGPSIAAIRVDAISAGGRTPIGSAAIYPIFVTPMRWRVVQYRVLMADHETRRRYCEALRALFTARLPELQAADRVELRQVVRWVDPARQEEPPIADELLCSWKKMDATLYVSDEMVDVDEAIPFLHRIYLREAPLSERMRSAVSAILGTGRRRED